MIPHMEYKGYLGSAEVDVDDDVVVGKLLFIRDTIAYSAKTPAELVAAFHQAVDEYIASCEADGVEPDLPCKGSFNVRIGPERHRDLAVLARRKNMGLNELICSTLDELLAGTLVLPDQRNPVESASTARPTSFRLVTSGGQLRAVK